MWIKCLLLSDGAGEFGSVMEGRLSQPEGTPLKVAVKTMKSKLPQPCRPWRCSSKRVLALCPQLLVPDGERLNWGSWVEAGQQKGKHGGMWGTGCGLSQTLF